MCPYPQTPANIFTLTKETINIRRCYMEVFYKKVILKIFAKFEGNTPANISLFKVFIEILEKVGKCVQS